jgi:alpha-N-arabinofuranosidase
LSARPSFLRLQLRPEQITEMVNPSFVGRRQQHIDFAARAAMQFNPKAENECAGIVLLQNSNFHYRCVITLKGTEQIVRLVKCEKGEESMMAEIPLSGDQFYFRVEAKGQSYSLFIAIEPEAWQSVAKNLDGRILSTPVATGFIGAYIGMYASSNGAESDNHADFDWFEYQGLS